MVVKIYAVNPSDPYSRYWTIWKNGTEVKQIIARSGYTWNLDLEAGAYEFGVSQVGGAAYGTYSGTINGISFSGVDGTHNVQFTVGTAPPNGDGGIKVSVSNLNPTPGETVRFTGSADPVEDISMNVYDALTGEHVAVYTIYLKTHGLDYRNLKPGILAPIIQIWKSVGVDTRTEGPEHTITIRNEVPPDLTITLAASKTAIEPNDIVTFSVQTNPAATYTVTLEAYVGGVREGLWRVPITDGYGITRLKPGEIATVVEWIVKDDDGNESNTVTTTVGATGPPDGKINAIRAQDVSRHIGFDWDQGIGWNPRPPVVTPEAGALYISAHILNNGEAGNITATIKDDQGKTLSSKTDPVAAGGSMGIESTGPMPNRNYDISVITSPGETFNFTIIPYEGVPPPPPPPPPPNGDGDIIEAWNNLPTWQKAAIASTAIVGLVGGGYAVTRRK